MLDLLKIAVTESEGGDLETVLGQLYQKTEVGQMDIQMQLFGKAENMIKL